ncbi:MAG: PEP-CTERM sorting domain-containing protein [Phycisphaerales bacterium]|nr:PEP-CTERM sorting domain-containing protein [Phycisphaerales bacterium]
MSNRFAIAAFVVVGVAASAFADDISASNGLFVRARVFNDFPTSTLTIDGVSQPVPLDYARPGMGTFHINEQFPMGTLGSFANKHMGYLSGDAGASPLNLHIGQSWSLDVDVKISAPSGAPRKEGAIQIENPRPSLGFVDEGHILVASDGEVAVFGGAMPFTGFGNSYTLGQTAHLTFRYFAPGEMDPTLGAYQLIFSDPVLGVKDSGVKIWGAGEPDGIKGFNDGTHLAFVAQNQRNPVIDDSSDFIYSNITIVPAPGALALLGVGGLVAARRRR